MLQKASSRTDPSLRIGKKNFSLRNEATFLYGPQHSPFRSPLVPAGCETTSGAFPFAATPFLSHNAGLL